MKKIAADKNYRLLKIATRRGTFGPIYDKALDLAREDGWYGDGGDRTGDMEPFYSHHVHKDKLLQTDLVEMYWDKAAMPLDTREEAVLDQAHRDGWEQLPTMMPSQVFKPYGAVGKVYYKSRDTKDVLSEKDLIKMYRDLI